MEVGCVDVIRVSAGVATVLLASLLALVGVSTAGGSVIAKLAAVVAQPVVCLEVAPPGALVGFAAGTCVCVVCALLAVLRKREAVVAGAEV